MAIASYWLPALRRWLLGIVLLSLLTPLGSAGQPRQAGYRVTQLATARLPDLSRLPMQLAVTELLAAEALGYEAGTTATRPRSPQPRAGSWWAWLSMAVLSAALLWLGLALRAARRFNRELAAQVGALLGYLCYLPPAPAAAPEPLMASPPASPSPAAPPESVAAAAPEEPAPVPITVPEPVAPHQQQALYELQQAAETALTDADFGPAQLAEQLALGERTLYRYIKELTGLTPAVYLRELRLQHAYCLLENQACPSVAEVAYQSGFNDPSYFGQVFQKRFGKKPSAYL